MIRDPSWTDRRYRFELEGHADRLEGLAAKAADPDFAQRYRELAADARTEAAKLPTGDPDAVIRRHHALGVGRVTREVGQRIAAGERAKAASATMSRPGPPIDPVQRAAYFRRMADESSDMKLAAGYRELAAELDPEPTDAEKGAQADRLESAARCAPTSAESAEYRRLAAEIRREIP